MTTLRELLNLNRLVTCIECGQQFDLTILAEADEWFGGHDCE